MGLRLPNDADSASIDGFVLTVSPNKARAFGPYESRLLKVKDNWEEAGNLYLVMVAVSGLGKSPCFKAFLQAVWKEEIKNKEERDEAMACYNAIIEERRQRKDRQNLPDPPPKPVRTQYIIEDATTEAIGCILAENPMGLLWYSDELSSILLNLDRYSLQNYAQLPWIFQS